MELGAERLELIPLTARQLKLWLNDVEALGNELNCSYHGEPMKGQFVEFIRERADKAENDSENYLFQTLWFIVRKADRLVMGEIAFTGTPDENHEVEIGYGLSKEFESMGYMSEAVKVLCEWALTQEEINHVIAETENNPKSENILKRVGFMQYKQNDTTAWWRI